MKKNMLINLSVTNKTLTLLAVACFSLNYTFAQLSPLNDPSWVLVPIASDEFDGPLLDNTKWGALSGITNVSMDPQNTIVDDQYPTGSAGQLGALRLKYTASNTTPPTQNPFTNSGSFTGSGIGSNQNYQYKYGYYEIRAKLPGYFDGNGQLTELGIIPQFWLSKECWCDPNAYPPYCPLANTSVKDEVDIVEGDGLNNKDFAMDSHWWKSTGVCPNPVFEYSGQYVYQPVEIDMVNTFHKFGCELMPDKLIFYFDDVPVNSITSFAGLPGPPTNTMTVWIDLAYGIVGQNPGILDPVASVDPNPMNTKIEFIVDYFRYYTVKVDNCNVDYPITNNTDLTGLPNSPPETWRDVIVNGVVNLTGPNSVKTVRHSSEFTVLLGSDFEVPVGSELSVIPTACQ